MPGHHSLKIYGWNTPSLGDGAGNKISVIVDRQFVDVEIGSCFEIHPVCF